MCSSDPADLPAVHPAVVPVGRAGDRGLRLAGLLAVRRGEAEVQADLRRDICGREKNPRNKGTAPSDHAWSLEDKEGSRMSFTNAAMQPPERVDYHLWCACKEDPPMMSCLYCGARINLQKQRLEEIRYGCPDNPSQQKRNQYTPCPEK